MSKILDDLIKMQDFKYREFQAKLIPNINSETIIGIRTPELRKYAKDLVKKNEYRLFLDELPHKYFDENQLHAFIISELKDFDLCIFNINKFLPYVDNWATCDQLSPKVFKKRQKDLLKHIKVWISSKDTYSIRFGIGVLMQYFLDDYFKSEYLKLVSSIKSNDYYVNMMISWFFATALAKQYEKTLPFIENNVLDSWIHNKTIQKAIESYRIPSDRKEYLKGLKV